MRTLLIESLVSLAARVAATRANADVSACLEMTDSDVREWHAAESLDTSRSVCVACSLGFHGDPVLSCSCPCHGRKGDA